MWPLYRDLSKRGYCGGLKGEMEPINLVLCGLGGQGILFMTRILAEAALGKGFQVIGAETHGMAQRGGSVISHLKIGKANSSLVRAGAAHVLLGMDEKETYRNLAFVRPGGKIYVNAPSGGFPVKKAKDFMDQKGIIYRAMAVGEIAMELGAPRATNLGLLGLFGAFENEPLGEKDLRETIERISPERFRDLNIQVFETCMKRAL